MFWCSIRSYKQFDDGDDDDEYMFDLRYLFTYLNGVRGIACEWLT